MRATQKDQEVVRRIGHPGDLGWVVLAHGELYAQEFGWNSEFEALVGQIVASFGTSHDDRREAAWIAELDGRRVGCVFCVAKIQPQPSCAFCSWIPRDLGAGWGAAWSIRVLSLRGRPLPAHHFMDERCFDSRTENLPGCRVRARR
ncbi:hypothetical protein [Paenarthrobacter sp. Z7-10]|uniref:hypothetical protein n=1 Tax=Paenarthrobacter sp. Z7-10 TaxID=2787635 RepID=UPI0022A9BE91|nr:hypothetical protein [Paenarthrobacter sp. Z7-10]